jgi:nitrogen fixation protein
MHQALGHEPRNIQLNDSIMSTVVISPESCYTSLPDFFRRNSGQTNSLQEKFVNRNLKKSLSLPVSASPLSWEAMSIKNAAKSSKTSLLTNGNKLALPATPTETQLTWTATKRLISSDCDIISSGMF